MSLALTYGGTCEFGDGIQGEMLSAMSSFYQGAAAACAEVCIKRLRLLQSQMMHKTMDEDRSRSGSLSRSFSRRRHSSTASNSNGNNNPGSRDDRLPALVHAIQRRLDAQGETLPDFLLDRSIGQGLITREDFVAGLSSLSGLSTSISELMDLFARLSGSSDRDTVLVDDLAMAAEMLLRSPSNMQEGQMYQQNGSLQVFPEAESVIRRVRNAVGRSGRPFDEVFKGFCQTGTGGMMSRTDLARVLSTFQPDLEPEIVTRLWSIVTPGGASGIDYATFCAWFCPGGKVLNAASSPTGYGRPSFDATSVYGATNAGMLRQLLDLSPASPARRSRSPSAAAMYGFPGGGDITPTSRSLGGGVNFEATSFDGTGYGSTMRRDISRERLRAAEFVREMGPAQLDRDELPLIACLHRLNESLKAKGLNFSSAFVLYDRNMERAVGLGGMIAACEHHGLSLSKRELETLFTRLARSPPNGQPPRIFFDDLEAAAHGIPNPLPEAQRAKDLILAVDKITRGSGKTLEAEFKETGREIIPAIEVQSILSRHVPLSDAQWAALHPHIEKELDGSVRWRSVLQWAGLIGGSADAATAAAAAVVAARPATAPLPTTSAPLAPAAAAPKALAAPTAAHTAPAPAPPPAVPATIPAPAPAAPTPLAPPAPTPAPAPLAQPPALPAASAASAPAPALAPVQAPAAALPAAQTLPAPCGAGGGLPRPAPLPTASAKAPLPSFGGGLSQPSSSSAAPLSASQSTPALGSVGGLGAASSPAPLAALPSSGGGFGAASTAPKPLPSSSSTPGLGQPSAALSASHPAPSPLAPLPAAGPGGLPQSAAPLPPPASASSGGMAFDIDMGGGRAKAPGAVPKRFAGLGQPGARAPSPGSASRSPLPGAGSAAPLAPAGGLPGPGATPLPGASTSPAPLPAPGSLGSQTTAASGLGRTIGGPVSALAPSPKPGGLSATTPAPLGSPSPLPGRSPLPGPGSSPAPLPGASPTPLPGTSPMPLPGASPSPLPGASPAPPAPLPGASPPAPGPPSLPLGGPAPLPGTSTPPAALGPGGSSTPGTPTSRGVVSALAPSPKKAGVVSALAPSPNRTGAPVTGFGTAAPAATPPAPAAPGQPGLALPAGAVPLPGQSSQPVPLPGQPAAPGTSTPPAPGAGPAVSPTSASRGVVSAVAPSPKRAAGGVVSAVAPSPKRAGVVSAVAPSPTRAAGTAPSFGT